MARSPLPNRFRSTVGGVVEAKIVLWSRSHRDINNAPSLPPSPFASATTRLREREPSLQQAAPIRIPLPAPSVFSIEATIVISPRALAILFRGSPLLLYLIPP